MRVYSQAMTVSCSDWEACVSSDKIMSDSQLAIFIRMHTRKKVVNIMKLIIKIINNYFKMLILLKQNI